jgi:hypothetical protein
MTTLQEVLDAGLISASLAAATAILLLAGEVSLHIRLPRVAGMLVAPTACGATMTLTAARFPTLIAGTAVGVPIVAAVIGLRRLGGSAAGGVAADHDDAVAKLCQAFSRSRSRCRR